MSITTPPPAAAAAAGGHPLLAAVEQIESAFDEIVGVDPLYLTAEQKGVLLAGLTRVATRAAALRGQVLAVSEDLAVATANRSAGTWLAAQTRTGIREAIHDERLGATLRQQWTQVGAAAAAGVVTWDQAGVIARALDALPDDLDAELLVKAEAHLVTEAGHFGPSDLARLGRRVLDVVAPDIAEAEEEKALRAEEHRARAAAQLSFRPRGDGTTDLYVRVPDHVASRLRVYLDAHTAPRRDHLSSEVDRLPLPRRRGEAFCTLLEHVRTDALPRHGGTATTVIVTIDYDKLRTGLGLAETSTGETITASEARRLACTAGILPAVLGGKSEVLDLGRTSRLFSPAQRTAMLIRDRGCRAEGCTIPAAWCEAHHATAPWTRHGNTDLADGVLLCSFHHHKAHDQRYHTTRQPNGNLRIVRRT